VQKQDKEERQEFQVGYRYVELKTAMNRYSIKLQKEFDINQTPFAILI